MSTHQTAKTLWVDGSARIAYRQFGEESGIPILFFVHFRGTMDHWDPLLINSIAAQRPVILFDNAGVGQSSGSIDTTVKGMVEHAAELLTLISVSQVDTFGFSMVIVADSTPSSGEGIVPNSETRLQVMGELAGAASPVFSHGFDTLFYLPSKTSLKVGRTAWNRIQERGPTTSGEGRSQLVSQDYADGGEGIKDLQTAIKNWRSLEQGGDGSYNGLSDFPVPVLIIQGSDDFMIPAVNSFVMQQKPPNSKLVIYPDPSHGFLYQWADEVAGEVNLFLNAA